LALRGRRRSHNRSRRDNLNLLGSADSGTDSGIGSTDKFGAFEAHRTWLATTQQQPLAAGKPAAAPSAFALLQLLASAAPGMPPARQKAVYASVLQAATRAVAGAGAGDASGTAAISQQRLTAPLFLPALLVFLAASFAHAEARGAGAPSARTASTGGPSAST
jgi:hypothetical protein